MASGRKPISDRAYLVELEQQIGELHKEATRLNRRLRDARAAVHTCEDGLAALAASVQTRLAEADSSGPSARGKDDAQR